jgi:hypothetical protein
MGGEEAAGTANGAAKRQRHTGNEGQSTVVILDYGSQYSQLITRRVREIGVFSVMLPGDADMVRRKKQRAHTRRVCHRRPPDASTTHPSPSLGARVERQAPPSGSSAPPCAVGCSHSTTRRTASGAFFDAGGGFPRDHGRLTFAFIGSRAHPPSSSSGASGAVDPPPT